MLTDNDPAASRYVSLKSEINRISPQISAYYEDNKEGYKERFSEYDALRKKPGLDSALRTLENDELGILLSLLSPLLFITSAMRLREGLEKEKPKFTIERRKNRCF